MALVCVIGLMACGDVRPENELPAVDEPVSVVVRPPTMRLRARESRQLAAQANMSNGQPVGGAAITYASATPDLLRVSAQGMVTSLGPVGSGEISVASGAVETRVPIQIISGAPASVVVHAGGEQTGAVAEMLAEPVAGLVADDDKNPVRGVVIDFHLTASAGKIEPSHTVTDVDGLAQGLWTLGPRAGRQLLSAQIEGQPDSSVSIAARAVAGPVRSLVGTDTITTARSGEPLTFRVQAIDGWKNPVANLPLDWKAAGGVLEALTPTTDAAGTASANWIPGPAGPTDIVVSTRTVTTVERVWTVQVVAGVPKTLVALSSPLQSGVASRAAPTPPSLRVEDAHGNAIADTEVTFQVVGGGGTLEATTVLTDAKGIATVEQWTWGSEGEQVLEASIAGGSSPLRFVGEFLVETKRRR